MRFVDEVEVVVQSGRGGKGSSSFRREKYVPMGGPDGGDGGRGGHVILRASSSVTTLLDLRSKALWRAGDGTPGGLRQMTGAQGEDLVIPLPVGTIVVDTAADTTLFELLAEGEERVLCPGGKGGLGNIHFKSSTNRAPRQTTPGEPGRTLRVRLELKLMADVGLLGWPNAGKSTFISVVSAARPKVADYPFTTLVPNLGVVDMGIDGSFVIADIPGIIEGAAEGRGLGHQFLRHVERTRVLLHLVALTDEGEGEVAHRYRVLREELQRYDEALGARPEIVVLTKADAVDEASVEAAVADLRAAGAPHPRVISSITGRGVQALVHEVWSAVRRDDAPPAGADRL
jgi:GTP-binding protein